MKTLYLKLEVSVHSVYTPAAMAHAVQEAIERNGISVDKIHASQTPPPDPEPLIRALMQTIKYMRGDRDSLPYPELAKVVDGAMVGAVEVSR